MALPYVPRLILVTLLVVVPWSASPAGEADAAFFRQHIAPVLERSCVGCHHGVAARAGLSLDARSALAKGGDSGPAIDDDDRGASLLLEMISGDQPLMPKDGPPLSKEEQEHFRRWVEAGAPWPEDVVLQDKRGGKPWWSLRPLVERQPPAMTDAEAAGWIRNPIDAFVLAALRERNLTASPEADRAVLIRRLSFDLCGLPPAPEEVARFVANSDPQAYEKLVDRLLDSPRYGEHWARHWLDVVHYGETHGYDKDKRRDHAWPYRDYVIRAFNDDKPYARFVREQIAGDVLYPDDPDALIATGFIAAGPWDFVGHVELREGTVEKEKTRALDRDDMVASTISTFNSMTVHCARCHDHAFDPIPQRDYYRLQAVFAGVDRKDVGYDVQPRTARLRRRLLHEKDCAARSLSDIEKQIQMATAAGLAPIDAKLADAKRRLQDLPSGVANEEGPAVSPSNGYHSEISHMESDAKWVQVDLGEALPIESVRLIPARPTDFADTPGFGFPVRFRIELANNPEFRGADIADDRSTADFANPGNSAYAIVLEGRRARYVRVTALKLWPRSNDFVFALGELQVESGGKNVAPSKLVTAFDSIEAGRWGRNALVDGFDSRHRLLPLDPQLVCSLRERMDLEKSVRRLEAERERTAVALVPTALAQERMQLGQKIEAIERQLGALPEQQLVYAIESHKPREIRVLNRGNVEKPGELAEPGALSCLADLPADFGLGQSTAEGARRSALADWITDRRNCLTWRSIVNRAWHYHFGRGLVDTPSDFGRNGGQPTHPELLDWLAVDFRDNGQSLKRLHRLIVTSATYRQAVVHQPEAGKLDAGNQFLWRMNRRRLTAEEIRDAVLAVSGKLDLTMGGPSFELFEFKDDHSPHYNYVPMDKPEVWRRTIYRRITRSVPDPWMETLDCPDPSLSAPVRTITITALQALATLNDDFVIRQAQYIAERLRRETPDLAGQIDLACLLCFARLPDERQRTLLSEYARQFGLANLCRLLVNSNEFLFVD